MTTEEIIKKNKNNKKIFYYLKGGNIVAEKKKIANSLEELNSQFESVDEKYDISTNKDNRFTDNLNLTKLDNISMSEDEISKLAKDSLQDYYQTNINSINSKNKNTIDNLKDSIEKQTENAVKLKDNVNKTIEEVKQDASNDAIKRGLSRSSIVINKLNAFDNAKIEEYNQIDKELTNSVNKINNEITKYNNEIAQIEAKYEKDKLDSNNDLDQQDFNNYLKLSDFIVNYGVSSLNAVKNNEKYEYAYDYFSSLSKEDAYNILMKNENMLKKELGTTYFNQLVKNFYV